MNTNAEKILLRGTYQLSDQELLEMLIGEVDMNALGSLYDLGKHGYTQLSNMPGIGPAKACRILAACEIGRRRLYHVTPKPQITSSREAFKVIASKLMDLPHEEFWILCLNRANRVVATEFISSGGISGTVVDAKLVFTKALWRNNVCSLILAHNHPSGNLQPSQADIDLTKKLVSAGDTLDLKILDHLIVAEAGYYSMADEGII
jgi:DNA repair protein RadC